MNNGNNSINTQRLYKFLNQFKADPGRHQISHTSMGIPYGRFSITGKQQRDKFMKLYNSAIMEGATLHLTENHRSQGPIIVDLDMKYKSDNNKRMYTIDHIMKVIKEYNRIITKYLKLDETRLPDEVGNSECVLQVFVFEKPTPTQQADCSKDGIHLMYPFICTEPEIQYIMREEVVQTCKNENWFKDLNLINSIEDVFDKTIIKKTNWMMYGSCKPNCSPYVVTKAYYNMDSFDIEQSYETKRFPEIFSIRKFNPEDITPFQNGITKEDIMKKCETLGYIKIEPAYKPKSDEKNPNDVRIAKRLTELLSVNRASDYYQWMQLGWCLHNIDETLLDTWIEFSKKSSKFIPGDCEKRWQHMKSMSDGFSIGSLYKWAKDDDPYDFNKIIFEEKMNDLSYQLECLHI